MTGFYSRTDNPNSCRNELSMDSWPMQLRSQLISQLRWRLTINYSHTINGLMQLYLGRAENWLLFVCSLQQTVHSAPYFSYVPVRRALTARLVLFESKTFNAWIIHIRGRVYVSFIPTCPMICVSYSSTCQYHTGARLHLRHKLNSRFDGVYRRKPYSLSTEVTSQKLVVNYVRSDKMLSVDRNVMKSIFMKFLWSYELGGGHNVRALAYLELAMLSGMRRLSKVGNHPVVLTCILPATENYGHMTPAWMPFAYLCGIPNFH